MANQKAQFEIQDILGSTKHYSGTVGTSPVTIPSVADKAIAEFFIESDMFNTPVNKVLYFSCDGGLTYTPLRTGEAMIWSPKGKVKQIYIKGSAAGVDYEMIVNYEEIA